MTPDFRALCAELVRRWDTAPCWPSPSQRHDLLDIADAMNRARTLLDQPEPQPPVAGEVAASLIELRSTVTGLRQQRLLVAAQRVERAADLLQHQHPQPVAVNEGLPGPENCDGEGYCWWWRTDEVGEWWEFLYLRDARDHNRRCGLARYTHWLPYRAIPNLPNPND